MSAPRRSTSPRPAKRALAAGACLLALGLAGCSGDTSVAAPDAEERQQIAAQLAKATQAQGVCYGWMLEGGLDSVSRGSNLGDNVAVDTDPRRCPKWVEVRAWVTYPPESSESDDSATVQVETSPDLDVGPMIKTSLDRFGLNEAAFIDDPALAISRAALALPLLTAESGAAEPAPAPSAPASAAPTALDQAGNDFWRDRWIYLTVGAGLLSLAGLFVVIGIRQRGGSGSGGAGKLAQRR